MQQWADVMAPVTYGLTHRHRVALTGRQNGRQINPGVAGAVALSQVAQP